MSACAPASAGPHVPRALTRVASSCPASVRAFRAVATVGPGNRPDEDEVLEPFPIARLRQDDPELRISDLKDIIPLRRPKDLTRYAEGLRLIMGHHQTISNRSGWHVRTILWREIARYVHIISPINIVNAAIFGTIILDAGERFPERD